ncbi:MAG: KpsF/GutQ family sugar-phosphate isomerase, partial [Acidaminococcaceae bacterium]|nr:KpsF/GutQ family sugar-phosphate isomerase [Acidaminococcaceae bacterium]
AAVEMILACQGRVVMTGMGKSGIIAHKISATLASTGTPSFYLHPAEGIHGDLGMVTADDVVIAMSNSGETGEVLNILPSLRRIGAKLIAMVGNAESTLAKNSDVVLDVGVKREACPLGLAPTSSTTAALAFGDALAMALMGKHHFTSKQFAVFHPGGSLGRKLLLTVGDIMHSGSENPVVKGTATVTEALFIITDKGLGAVSVVDDNNIMIGLLTDGDIRRGLSKGVDFLKRPVTELMTKSPKFITKEKLAAQALHIMESHTPKPITVLPVLDEERHVIGLLHMTDLVRQGVV